MARYDDVEELVGLLPFYVSNRLSEPERRQVNSALANSDELRAELDEQVAIAYAVKQQGELMMAGGKDPKVRLEKVVANLDVKAPEPKRAAPEPANLANLLRFLSPAKWHAAVSLSLAVAVAGMGGTIIAQNEAGQEREVQMAALEKRLSDAEFQLASGPGGAASRGNIMIELRDTAPWDAVEAMLSAEGLTIVGGPSDGALTLSSEAKGAALDALITRLKASPLVASVDKAV